MDSKVEYENTRRSVLRMISRLNLKGLWVLQGMLCAILERPEYLRSGQRPHRQADAITALFQTRKERAAQ